MQASQQLDRSKSESNGATDPTDPTEADAIARIPDALDSPRTKLVYLHLATGGERTVEEVRDALGIELISLYPVLDALTSEGLVRKDGSRYACSNT